MSRVFKSRILGGIELLMLSIIVLIVLIPYFPSDRQLASRDSGVFLYTGWRVLNGEVPYLDIWDHKPPVIYYLDAFGLWLTPESSQGVWYVELIMLSVAVLSGYGLLRALFGVYPAMFSTVMWVFTAFYLLAGGNLTTEYALPFQFILLFLFWMAEKRRYYGWLGACIGAISAILFFTRQNAIGIPIAIGIYMLGTLIGKRDYKKSFRDMGSVLGGVAGVFALVIGYFYFNGALAEFWETAFLYNVSYVDERNFLDRINSIFQGLNQLENLGLAQLSFWGWGICLILFIYKKSQIVSSNWPVLLVAIAALPIELWMVSLGGRPRIPYFLVLLPILSVLSCLIVWLIFESITRDVPRFVLPVFACLMIIALGSVFFADYGEILKEFSQTSDDTKILAYIVENSDADDYVLMWGAESVYNFAARRASPSRFVYQTPLYNEKNKEHVIEFLKSILEKQPRMIVMRPEDKLTDFRFAYRDNEVGMLMDQIKGIYTESVMVDQWQIFKYSGE